MAQYIMGLHQGFFQMLNVTRVCYSEFIWNPILVIEIIRNNDIRKMPELPCLLSDIRKVCNRVIPSQT